MYALFRPLLFRLDPERAHGLTLALLRWSGQLPITYYFLRSLFELTDPRLEVEAFGLRFKNPVGLAAGYDKNGIAVRGLSALGFGHVEVGTVTRLPQAGHPRPRIFRLPEAGALINRLGFPNEGVERLRAEGEKWKVGDKIRIGVNIGKGKETPLERAAEDYCALLEQVHDLADYVAINISSPNTPGLRQLQARAALRDLLAAVADTRARLTPRLPLLVKIAPDLTEPELDDVLEAVLSVGMDGLIAANTTLRRDGLPACAANTRAPLLPPVLARVRASKSASAGIAGGLSGAPLRTPSTEIIRYLARRTDGRLPIVGVGGILSPRDAIEKLEAGARLIQVYTGLIYAGPGLAQEINRALLRRQ
jgi:dihydroorotate dehydrogenase